MKTSWNNTQQIERYLNNDLSQEERIVFEAQLILDPVLKLNVGLQRKIHKLVTHYGRKKIKAEIEQVHCKLFQSREHIVFQQSIYQLFKDN
jgi:hypothetical protein